MNRFSIDESMAGRRLDQVLAHLLPEHSRSFLGRLIDEGRVLVDGAKAAKRSQPVSPGQVVEVDVPDPEPTGVPSQEIPLQVLFQDAHVAVIDKPAGMVAHPAAGHRDQTLVNALLFHMQNLSGIGGEIRPGLVHRLDKDTSGLMVVAKNDAAHRRLTEAWGTDRVRKEYLALVYGTPRQMEGTIDAPIGRDPRNRKRMAVVAGGRRAVTLYRLVERFPHLSLLRCELKTGRTHQIRVHLKSLGHPIVGDPLYSGPQWRGIPDASLRKILSSFPRQALHAARLTFPHPESGEAMTFESPLPEEFAGLLEQLRG